MNHPRRAPRPSADAHHVLSEWHHYGALAAACSPQLAAAETGAPAEVHAARLGAALGDVLAELAAVQVLAAHMVPCAWCEHADAAAGCGCEDGPGNLTPCPCNAARQLAEAEAQAEQLGPVA